MVKTSVPGTKAKQAKAQANLVIKQPYTCMMMFNITDIKPETRTNDDTS
jgi:hypothetical protein